MSAPLEYVGLPGTYRHYTFTHQRNHEPVGEFQLRWPDYTQTVELWSFEVYPAYRGEGYGRKLLDFAIRRAAKGSVDASSRNAVTNRKWLTLQVKARNYKAIKLYKSCGFVVSARHKHSGDVTMSKFL